jgi:hypothetical protein
VTKNSVTFPLIVSISTDLLSATWYLKVLTIVSTDNENQMTALYLKKKEKPLTCICVRRDPPLGLDVTLAGASIMVAMVTPCLWHDGWNMERKS